MLKRLLRAGLWVFLGILLGRIAGLVREMLVAHYFGASAQADVAALLLTVPDTLINILIGGAMGAALIPEFQRLSLPGRWKLYKRASLLIAAVFAPLTLLLAWQAESVVRLFAPGFPADTVEVAASLLQVTVWAIPIAAVAAVDRAFLQAGGRFALTSMTTVVYNGALIVALTLGPLGAKLGWLSVAAVLGAGLGFALQVWDARRLRPASADDQDPRVDRGLAMRYGQAMLAGGLILLLPALARALISGEGEGAFARLNFAIKMVELPLGLVLTVFSVVLYPTIAALFADPAQAEEGERLARQGLTLVLGLAVTIALGMGWFARDFVWLLYGHGRVDDAGLAGIALLATGLMFGLVAQSLFAMVLVVLNARQDMLSPFLASVGGLAAFLILALFLRPAMGEMAVAAAYAATHWLMVLALVAVARVRHRIDLVRALVGPGALAGVGVIVMTFLALTSTLQPLASKSMDRVLLAVFVGLVAWTCGVMAVADQRRAIMAMVGRLGRR